MNKRRLTIGYISVQLFDDSIALELQKGINQAAKDFNINLVSISGSRYFLTEQENWMSANIYKNFITDLDLINKHNFDGLIIWGSSLNAFLPYSKIPQLIKSFKDLPIINIAGIVEGIPSILIDNYNGIKLVLKHLIEHHGFTKIAFIRGKQGHHYSDARLNAYCDILN